MSTENQDKGPIGTETVARLLKIVNSAEQAKKEDPFYITAEKLYGKLNSMYSSPYFPSSDEREEAIQVIKDALKSGVQPSLMLLRMSQLEKLTDYKSKISTVITGRFWEKEYIKPIPYNEYDPKKFL